MRKNHFIITHYYNAARGVAGVVEGSDVSGAGQWRGQPPPTAALTGRLESGMYHKGKTGTN